MEAAEEKGRREWKLSTLMIDTLGDIVWYLSCVQQASYLEGPLILPLYLHVNQKYDDDDDEGDDEGVIMKSYVQWNSIQS